MLTVVLEVHDWTPILREVYFGETKIGDLALLDTTFCLFQLQEGLEDNHPRALEFPELLKPLTQKLLLCKVGRQLHLGAETMLLLNEKGHRLAFKVTP